MSTPEGTPAAKPAPRRRRTTLGLLIEGELRPEHRLDVAVRRVEDSLDRLEAAVARTAPAAPGAPLGDPTA